MTQMSKQQWERLCPRCGKEKNMYAKLCSECEKKCCKLCGNYIEDENGICKKCIDELRERNRVLQAEISAANPSSKVPTNQENEQWFSEKTLFFASMIIFLVPIFFSTMSILDLYLFSTLAAIISILVALIASGILAVIIVCTRSVICFCGMAICMALLLYFSNNHVEKFKFIAEQKKEEKLQQEEILKQKYRDAPYRCNKSQREQAKSDLELMLLNGVAERGVDEGWIIYTWKKNWWFLSEQEQQASIRKVADIEACFSKEGYALPSVIISYTGKDVAKADSSNGVRIIKSRP